MTAATHEFTPGALVRARGREWVVLPGGGAGILRLRPLSGSEEDVALIHTGLEPDVAPASFPWPTAEQEGNQEAAVLLHDALRVSLRRGAGPFRSFGEIAVTPRPYQLVPLMMALSQEVVRLLIADDVGLGKTIEALLIVRELYDRGELDRFAVLCPPHLVEQWTYEISSRFHFPVEPVTAGTAPRLERGLPLGTSIFEAHPFTVVSLDYVKSDRRRDEFARSCPKAIIVDEAHTCTTGGTGRHQRFALVKTLLADPTRHAILCTATPHSGDEAAFVRLLGLVDPMFLQLEGLADSAIAAEMRERLAAHLVQRRRVDIREWHDEKLFPRRETADVPYRLTGRWERFLASVLDYCEGVTTRVGGDATRRRLAFWGTLALLRCVTSSPAAAARALRTRLQADGDPALLERLAAHVFEGESDEAESTDDNEPAADAGDAEVRALLEMADALAGDTNDPKLAKLIEHMHVLVRDGFSPIVFCHYIATANYVGERLRASFPEHHVAIVTGELPEELRRDTVERTGEHERRILVATDCMSEGVNLQEYFDAVVHYDLSWNPTRHEQREGRVDRFGQRHPVVRASLLLGENNPVDGAVLEVILRKAKRISERLGVPVPLPDDEHRLTEALLKAVLLRGRRGDGGAQLTLDLGRIPEEAAAVDVAWRDAEERARKASTKFAQRRLKPEQVMPEFQRSQAALGDAAELERFVTRSCARLGAEPTRRRDGSVAIALSALPPLVRERLSAVGLEGNTLRATLDGSGTHPSLTRSHPLVTTLADTLLERTLDADGNVADTSVLGRTGVWPTAAVERRTILVLARIRHELTTIRGEKRRDAMVEEALPVAIVAGSNELLTDADASTLLLAPASATLPPPVRQAQLEWLGGQRDAIAQALKHVAERRAAVLLDDHRRVRDAAKAHGRYEIRTVEPVDVIGAWVLLPEAR
ncbi:MAG: DEAD/DEAH box helicase [Gemmatimonadaceae bacterium]|nr:DEAD/DEAH box helicase [Gemmatimonadaceae bacterium]